MDNDTVNQLQRTAMQQAAQEFWKPLGEKTLEELARENTRLIVANTQLAADHKASLEECVSAYKQRDEARQALAEMNQQICTLRLLWAAKAWASASVSENHSASPEEMSLYQALQLAVEAGCI